MVQNFSSGPTLGLGTQGPADDFRALTRQRSPGDFRAGTLRPVAQAPSELFAGQRNIVFWPVNPKALKDYRAAFSVRGAKADRPEALLLEELVRRHRDKLRALEPDPELPRQLGGLTENRRHLADERPRPANQLHSLSTGTMPLKPMGSTAAPAVVRRALALNPPALTPTKWWVVFARTRGPRGRGPLRPGRARAPIQLHRSGLKTYHPLADPLLDGQMTRPMAADFLVRWPDLPPSKRRSPKRCAPSSTSTTAGGPRKWRPAWPP